MFGNLAPEHRFSYGDSVQKRAENAGQDAESVDSALRELLSEALGLPAPRVAAFTEASELFGALPEFDSMAVAAILTGIEDGFGVWIEDDEVEAEDFMTYGRLLGFTRRKVLG
jgi:acyl carrier protein